MTYYKNTSKRAAAEEIKIFGCLSFITRRRLTGFKLSQISRRILAIGIFIFSLYLAIVRRAIG